MADGFTFDFSEVNQLAANLGTVASSAGTYVRAAVDASSLAIKNDWREQASGLPHIKQYPGAITYTLAGFQGFGATVLKSEIGPVKRGQGNLGAILEDGSPTSSAHGWGNAALQRETPEFEKALSAALQRAEAALTLQGILRSVITGVN